MISPQDISRKITENVSQERLSKAVHPVGHQAKGGGTGEDGGEERGKLLGEEEGEEEGEKGGEEEGEDEGEEGGGQESKVKGKFCTFAHEEIYGRGGGGIFAVGLYRRRRKKLFQSFSSLLSDVLR